MDSNVERDQPPITPMAQTGSRTTRLTPALGAVWLGNNRCRFRVWAPLSKTIHLHIVAPGDRIISMEPKSRGYHDSIVEGIEPGTRYLFRLATGEEVPDPASRYQPEGVN